MDGYKSTRTAHILFYKSDSLNRWVDRTWLIVALRISIRSYIQRSQREDFLLNLNKYLGLAFESRTRGSVERNGSLIQHHKKKESYPEFMFA